MAELDDIFHEFAGCFAGAYHDAKPICFSDQLRRDLLDLTLESLKYVDEYLSYVHKHLHQLDPDEWNSTVLYGGAYVGEVIRNETNNHYHWIDYNDYMPQHPNLQPLIPERTVPTCAFIVDDKDRMTMPLNKVARFIADGELDSVFYFAYLDILHAKEENT